MKEEMPLVPIKDIEVIKIAQSGITENKTVMLLLEKQRIIQQKSDMIWYRTKMEEAAKWLERFQNADRYDHETLLDFEKRLIDDLSVYTANLHLIANGGKE